MPPSPSPDRSARILRLFGEAAELDKRVRRAYVERACPDDPAWQADVTPAPEGKVKKVKRSTRSSH